VKLELIRQRRRASLEQMLQANVNGSGHVTDERCPTDVVSTDLGKLPRYERMARAERRQALEQLARVDQLLE
jgi:hypothetical protein